VTVTSPSILPPFVSFEAPVFKFTPLSFDVGNYTLKVKLTDSGTQEKSTEYKFKLQVLSSSEKGEDSQDSQLDYSGLSASITDISMFGEIEVEFSEDVKIESKAALA